MKFSDDLLKSVSAILEAKPRVSFDGDKATVHSKNGTPMKSFSKKDLGNDFRKQADNFLSQNYKKLNAESVIVEELEEAKQLELPGMEQKKPKQLELPFGKKDDKKKPVKESEDQLDEISRSTMGSYVKKASDDVANRAYHSGGDSQDNEFNSSEKTPERKKLLNRKLGIKTAVKRLTKESEDVNAANAAKATMHDCANHVRHEQYGLGQTISTMHTLEEDEDGNGYVTHYDVMFQGEDGPFIMEDVWVEDLEIISEKHHGHPKGKKKMSEDVEAIEEKKGHKKDKGDMDGDGVDEPDDKEYMDNKDKAIKMAMSKKKSESPIKKVQEDFTSKIDQQRKKSQDAFANRRAQVANQRQNIQAKIDKQRQDKQSDFAKRRAGINEAPKYIPGFMGADGKPTSKPTQKDYDSNKEYQHMKRKLGDRIPGPPAKKINREHLESISTALQEISKKTLHNYVKKSRDDAHDRTHELHFLYHHTDGNHGDTADRFGGMHASGHNKLDHRNDGIQRAADRMADKKYGKAKPGKKTKLSKSLQVHPDWKPSTNYNESTEIQEISKGVLNRYQGMRRNDHDILGSRAAYHHQRAMDYGHGNYLSGHEKGKEKAAAHKELKDSGSDNPKKDLKKVAKHRDKEDNYENQRDKMDKGIDRAFKRLASDKYGKSKPGKPNKLPKDVKESNQYTDDLADRIRSHENKQERKKAEKAFTAGDYEKATAHIGGTYREK